MGNCHVVLLHVARNGRMGSLELLSDEDEVIELNLAPFPLQQHTAATQAPVPASTQVNDVFSDDADGITPQKITDTPTKTDALDFSTQPPQSPRLVCDHVIYPVLLLIPHQRRAMMRGGRHRLHCARIVANTKRRR